MRHMSFALTTEQVRNRTKTVTRRLGWENLQVGTLVQPVVKGQGLKKGEKVQKIGGPIRIIGVRRERLVDIGVDPNITRRFDPPEIAAINLAKEADIRREGFAGMELGAFFDMFCTHNCCAIEDFVTRIEFEYVETLGA